ncbi:LemA family protein [Candidatus Bathyarchaeota archaeon]|nr:LemA family protein [Candidatus Bathyarchaeota archaeon]
MLANVKEQSWERKTELNRSFLVIIVIVVSALIIGGIFAAFYFGTYNNIVALEATADEKWGQVEQELQRRYDLIPNVVNSAKLYITYEGSVLEEITRLRSQWAAASQSGDVDTVNNVTGELESSLSRLIVVFEDYPELEASQIIEDMMIELEGTENRISTERMRYNEAVTDYNVAIKTFPSNIWAPGWGFEAKSYFEAKVGAEDPPQVPG